MPLRLDLRADRKQQVSLPALYNVTHWQGVPPRASGDGQASDADHIEELRPVLVPAVTLVHDVKPGSGEDFLERLPGKLATVWPSIVCLCDCFPPPIEQASRIWHERNDPFSR